MKPKNCLLCQLQDSPFLTLIVAAFLLLVLYVFRRFLEPLFLIYCAILIFFGLVCFARFLHGRWRRWCRGKNLEVNGDPNGTGATKQPGSKGVYVPPHTYKRPDPMIYSQLYLMSQGLAVTWDNPDIQLFDGANPIDSGNLQPGKTYTIRAQVWNGSLEAPAVNMEVKFYYLSFGAGTVRNWIGQTMVDVPVKGAVGLPAMTEHQWTTPNVPGHYCIQVELIWLDDANPNNNLGQENVQVKKLNSPNATFEINLRNESALRKRLVLTADSYTLPARKSCDEIPTQDVRDASRNQKRDPFAEHRPSLFPLPDGWRLDYSPSDQIELAADEEVIVTVKVTALEGFVGRKAINVNAMDGSTPIGGVTLYVHH